MNNLIKKSNKCTCSEKKVFIKVFYGIRKDHRGKLVEFDNEGIYDNSKDLIYAAKAFTEEI